MTSFNPAAFLDQTLKLGTQKPSTALQNLESQVKSTLPQLIRSTLATEKIEMFDPIYSGSYDKGTDISTKRDIDYVLPFKAGQFKNSQEMFDKLYKILSRLQQEKKIPGLRLQRVSFGITYTTGQEELRFDLVPGREDKAGQYQNMGNLWLWDRISSEEILTNIRLQLEHFKKAPPMAKDLIRLLKLWKATPNGPQSIKSIVMELIVLEAYTSKTITEKAKLWEAFKTTFQHIASRDAAATLSDPGNPTNNLLDALDPDQFIPFQNRCKNILKDLDPDRDPETTLKKLFNK